VTSGRSRDGGTTPLPRQSGWWHDAIAAMPPRLGCERSGGTEGTAWSVVWAGGLSGRAVSRLDWTRLDWTRLHSTVPTGLELDWLHSTGLDATRFDSIRFDSTRLGSTVFDLTGLDWTGLDWTGLDWTGLDWTGLDVSPMDSTCREGQGGVARCELEATGAHSAGAAAATIDMVPEVTVTIWGHKRAAAEGNAGKDRGNMMQARYWVIQAR